MLTQERVLELFDYQDGDLIWKVSQGSAKKGDIKETVNGNGRKLVYIDKKHYLVHRVIFLMHHGFLPKEIDHIDNNHLNNRIQNLRECTHSQNCANKKVYKNNKTGYKGVSRASGSQNWRATIQHNNKMHYLGTFETPELAKEFRDLVALELHGTFARV
jgi:hypothetical protein